MALSAFELCEETFGMSRDDLESIIAFLRSAESRQMSHSDVEKLVRERSYELSRKLFQAHVDSRGPGEAAAPVRGADGVERDQERIHERGLTTIFGEIRVKRFGYGAEGADSLHPLDAELNLPRERYSFELRRTAAVEVSKGAFDEAVASLGRHTGAKVGKRQVEELAGRAAEDFDAFYGQRAPPAGDRSASVLAITADGKGVVMLRKDDPAFAPATPLCRELPTAAGPIDLAYMSEEGRLSIVECKLWRNPEARRGAVSQILDYAKEISRWSYDELNDAVCRAARRSGNTNALFDIVRAQHDTLDEATFVDDVARSLTSGRFLLIVVGDGIREGVERIADYLNHARRSPKAAASTCRSGSREPCAAGIVPPLSPARVVPPRQLSP